MIWIPLGMMLALLLHAGCAAFVMLRQARQVCGWHLAYPHALAGQLCITAIGLIAALLFDLVAGELGVVEMRALTILGAFVLLITWGVGLNGLTTWLAQRARGSFYSAATTRRVSSRTFYHLLAWYGGASLLALAAWRISDDPVRVAQGPALAPTAGANASAALPAAIPVAADTRKITPPVADRPSRLPGADPNAEPALRAALAAWAAAWSRRDADAYLAAYARGFRAPDGLSRAQWEAQRRQRIGAARFISVEIETDEVSFSEAGDATVRLRQNYRSDLTSAIDRKILRMVHEDEHWRILEERIGR